MPLAKSGSRAAFEAREFLPRRIGCRAAQILHIETGCGEPAILVRTTNAKISAGACSTSSEAASWKGGLGSA